MCNRIAERGINTHSEEENMPLCQSPSLLSLLLFSHLVGFCVTALEPKSYTNLLAECGSLGSNVTNSSE